MAFAGVDNARKVPAIWIHFGKTKSKSLDTHRRVIKTSMTEWGRNTRTEVYKIFLEAKMIEDIIALCFNPGNSVANTVRRNKESQSYIVAHEDILKRK